MAADPINSRPITQAGFAALKRGDPAAARACFERSISTGTAEAAAWFGLSLVHRSEGASQEESFNLDQALKLDARYLPALLAKGDWFAKSGDRRAASSYYRAVIKLAATLTSVPADLRAELARAEAASRRFAREFEEHLLSSLSASGLGTPGSERFGHAIELLLGKKQIYLQQPKYFFFPELAQIQFFEPRTFEWAGALEQEFDAIRAEITAVLADGGGFVPYLQPDASRPSFDTKQLIGNPDWSAYFLIKDGVAVAAHMARCPRTAAALSRVPLCRIDSRTPSVLFSLLRPKARIPPHHGFMNTRLICHLPLIVPHNCGLRVGNETREWREGELMVFDDTIEHEAWNSSNEPRVVLIFDVWRPELSGQERQLVSAMLAAIDGFDGNPQKWTD
jgi:aspartyl/asparaginyl beta-hydroxylase (cupin superfamily)